jgi:hypothetical protein
VPEPVSGATAEQEQAGHGEVVAVDDPLQARDRGAQVRADGGQRDVHDGRVEHGHQLPGQHDRQHGAGSRLPQRRALAGAQRKTFDEVCHA